MVPRSAAIHALYFPRAFLFIALSFLLLSFHFAAPSLLSDVSFILTCTDSSLAHRLSYADDSVNAAHPPLQWPETQDSPIRSLALVESMPLRDYGLTWRIIRLHFSDIAFTSPRTRHHLSSTPRQRWVGPRKRRFCEHGLLIDGASLTDHPFFLSSLESQPRQSRMGVMYFFRLHLDCTRPFSCACCRSLTTRREWLLCRDELRVNSTFSFH